MDTWISLLRWKIEEGWRRRSRQTAIKAGILTTVLGAIAMWTYLFVAGLPR
jgi:hypothetical protein